MPEIVRTAAGVRIQVAHCAPVDVLAGLATPDGHGLILSAATGDRVRGWDATTGGQLVVPQPPVPGPVRSLAVADAAGRDVVVCGTRDGVYSWYLTSGEMVGPSIGLRAGGFVGNAIGPVVVLEVDGSPLLVSGGMDGRIRRWDLLSGAETGPSLEGHSRRVLALGGVRLDDGRTVIVSGGRDSTARRWDAVTGEQLGEPLPGDGGPVVAVACGRTGEGRSVAATQTATGVIQRWDAATGEPIGTPLTGPRVGGPRVVLAMSPDGRLLLCIGLDGSVSFWDLTASEPSALVLPHDGVASAATIVPSAGGRALLVTGGRQGEILRWEAPTGAAVGEDLAGHPGRVTDMTGVSASPGSTARALVISAGRDGARCWDATTGEPVGSPPVRPLPTLNGLAAARLHDGRVVLVTGDEMGIVRYDLGTGRNLDPSGHLESTTVWDVATGTLPDGRVLIAAAGDDRRVHRLDAATGTKLGPPLRGHEDRVVTVAVATLLDHSVTVASGGADGKIMRWDASSGRQLGTPLAVADCMIVRVAFASTPQGLVLACTDDHGRLWRWGAVTGEPFGEPFQVYEDEYDAKLLQLTVMDPPQPALLMTVGEDQVARWWDVLTGQLVNGLPGVSAMTTVTLLDGTTLLTSGTAHGDIAIEPIAAK